MTIFSKSMYLKPIQKYKSSLAVVPFFFTFANAILGLLSVCKALDIEYAAAAYCILLAAFMDGLDGRLARALGSTSILGMELDSLSDAISFCVAPVVLLYSWEVQDFGVIGFLVLAIYLCAGIFRLAKFNISENAQENNFMGLPTPVAAFFLTGLVLYQDWIEMSFGYFLLQKNILFCSIIFISFLMISKIRFPSFKQCKLNKGISFYVFIIAMTLLLFVTRDYPIMMLLPICYIFTGFSKSCFINARRFLTSIF